jgi:hypothetical protein
LLPSLSRCWRWRKPSVTLPGRTNGRSLLTVELGRRRRWEGSAHYWPVIVGGRVPAAL